MREYDDLPRIIIEERGGGAGVFMLGVLVGAGAALLLAPRGGRETQRAIAFALGGFRDAAEGRVDVARTGLAGFVNRSRETITDRVDAVRGAVDEKVEQARIAVVDGRTAAAQAREELARRVEEAKAAYRAGQRGAAPHPPGPRAVRSSGPESASASVLAPASVSTFAPQAAPRATRPELVVTAVSTEEDGSDLSGGAPPAR